MIKKISKFIFVIVGTTIGVSIFNVLLKTVGTSIWPGSPLTSGQELGMKVFFAIIFGFLFYILVPNLENGGKWFGKMLLQDLKNISAIKLVFGIIGLILGFVISFLLSLVYMSIKPQEIGTILTILTYMVLGYLGVMIFSERGRDILNQFISDKNILKNGLKREKHNISPKILDTSVIIDGRILEIMETGFLEGDIIIAEFVLLELQYIADSPDDLKRKRGRRGLDILKKIQEEFGVEIYQTTKEKAIEEIPDVDIKLLKLAQILGGKVVTNDFNLNKVAGLKGVEVLNINELANAVKPVVLPEEHMKVKPVKEGKEREQALAYLEDGTMIVVEGGRKYIGKEIDIKVTTVLQTPAGRMIFGRPER